MPDPFPQPPTDMMIPQTAQLFATIGLWVPATALFVAAAVYWRRSGSPVYLLGVFGGLIAAFNEPIADILLNCYHAEIGQWKVFSAFGRDIPLWAVGFYPIYFGGDQPYRVLGFPVLVGVLNTLGATLGATVMAHLSDWLTGRRRLLILVIPTLTDLAAYGVVLPHLLTLNSDASAPVKYLGTTAGILLALAALDGIGRFAARRFPVADPTAITSPTPIAAV